MNLNRNESNIISKFNYRDLMIFIVPVLIFGLYLFVFRPGVLTVASYSQLHEIAAGWFTTTYPIFHTFIEMLFLNTFKSPTYIGLFQILIFSLIWMIICKYHRNDLSQSSNEFVFQFIVTLIICLIPINAVYSITLSSNILFSYSILFLCFLIKVLVDKKGQIDTKLMIALAITLAFVSGLNNYGIIISLVSLAMIAYYSYKNSASQNMLFKLIAISLLCMVFIGSLTLIFDVRGSDYDVDTDKLNIPSNDAFEDGINLESARNEFLSSTNYHPLKGYENSVSRNGGNFNYNLIDSFVNLFRENFILDGLFNNPILYMIFSIVLLALIYVVTQNKEIFLLYAPPFLNMIVGFCTGQNNLYSCLLVFYLIVIIFISVWFALGLKPDNFKNATLTNTNPARIGQPKEIEAPPIVEPDQNYVGDDYYSDLEVELEELTMDDINEMLGKTPDEEAAEPESEGDDDLIDEILKEIELDRK